MINRETVIGCEKVIGTVSSCSVQLDGPSVLAHNNKAPHLKVRSTVAHSPRLEGSSEIQRDVAEWRTWHELVCRNFSHQLTTRLSVQ